MQEPSEKNHFYKLSPESVLNCLESEGFIPTGRLIPLNSYENRVYLIYLEDRDPVVAKFYRPNRWTREAINEEHLFMLQLKDDGFPVVPPLTLKNKDTVHSWDGMYFSLFNQRKGRMPYDLNEKDIDKVARSLARLHNVGAKEDFLHRPFLDGDEFGWQDLDSLESWIFPNLLTPYKNLATKIINQYIDLSEDIPFQRIHGDCHRGNLLSNDIDFFFVDFDDCIMGPVAQDLWMLLNGETDTKQTKYFLDAYRELRDFNKAELKLFPLLQGMRIIHYSAWIAKRWEDPSFPKIFPNFKEPNYWYEEYSQLESIWDKITSLSK